MELRASTLGFGNLLPQHRWMCKTAGGEFNPSGYCRVARSPNYIAKGPRWPNGRGACAVEVDPLCPDYTYVGTFEDDRTMTLPYTVQDTYDRAQVPTSVPVLTLSNQRMRATVTPQWGGRVWGLSAAIGTSTHSKRGGGDVDVDMMELVYKNLYFQPNNDALRQAYTQGGIEWNFGTQIGHASQTQDPVWAARLPTPHRGEVLRMWSFERISRAICQIDLMLDDAKLYAHIKLTPVIEDIEGYFWTNVAVSNDADGSTEMRILTPSKGFVSDEGVSAIAPWPYLYERALGTGAADGDYTYPTYPPTSRVPNASPLDHSYPYLWWEKRDVWFTATPDRTMRYNGWVDKAGSTFLHGHPGNGTKAWIWGTSPNERYWQRFGSANAHDVALQNSTYTELQAGVAPTQYQSFPVAHGSSRQWTEVFTTLGAEGRAKQWLSKLRSSDYHGTAIPAVDAWMDGQGLGSTNSSTYDAADAFLRRFADEPVREEQIVHRGEAFGGLEGMRLGMDTPVRLTPGTLFPTDTLSREERPWAELLLNGSFSRPTLECHPTSFMVDEAWMEVLRRSAARVGSSWLHEFHLATAELEAAEVPGDAHFVSAAAHFHASLAHRVSAEALRGVAIIQSAARNFSDATTTYRKALDVALASSDPDPIGAALLGRNLVAEFAQFLLLTGQTDAMKALVADPRIPAAGRAQDRFRMAEAHAAYANKDYGQVFHLLDCAPERQWPTLGYDLQALKSLYQNAAIATAAAAKGSPLSVLERNAAIRAHPVPACLAAIGH